MQPSLRFPRVRRWAADRLRDDDAPALRFGRDGAADRGVSLAIVAIMMVSVLAFAGFAVDLGLAYNTRRQAQSAADAGAIGGAMSLNEYSQGTTSWFSNPQPGLDKMVATIKYLTFVDVDRSSQNYTQNQWNILWNQCADPGALTYASMPTNAYSGSPYSWPFAGTTQCISISSDLTRVRVKTPLQTTLTSFAKLVGVNQFKESAIAEAQFNLNFPSGGVLPFGLTGSASSWSEICVVSGAGNVPADSKCQGGTSGNFNKMDISAFGNPTWGNDFSCSGSGAQNGYNADDRVAFNTAMGVDHPLGLIPNDSTGVFDTSATQIEDGSTCDSSPRNWLARPNTLDTQTGNAINAIHEGLISGWGGPLMNVSDPGGRLAKTCSFSYCSKTTNPVWGSTTLDNTGLWNFIGNGTGNADVTAGSGQTSNVPASCTRASFQAAGSYAWLNFSTTYGDTTLYPNASKAHMLRCFSDYMNGVQDYTTAQGTATVGTRIFGSCNTSTCGYQSILFGRDGDGDPNNGLWDIMYSPRFGYVPLLWETDFSSGGSGYYHIRTRRAIYLETAYFGCSNGNGCDTAFSPGETNDALMSPLTPWTTAASNTSLEGITAMSFVFFTMLPKEARDAALASPNDVGVTLVK